MSSKDAMKRLLELSPEERARFKAENGFEEVAHTYLTTAIAEGDGAMLKYVMELSEEAPEEGMNARDASLKDALSSLKGVIEDGQ